MLVALWTILFFIFHLKYCEQEIIIMKDKTPLRSIKEIRAVLNGNIPSNYDELFLVIGGSDSCHNISMIDKKLLSKAIVLLETDANCSFEAQIIAALDAGYNKIVYKDIDQMWRFDYSLYRSAMYTFVLLFVAKTDGEILAKSEYRTRLTLKIHIQTGMNFQYLALIIVCSFVCALSLSILMWHFAGYLKKKYKDYVAKRYIINLPSRKATQEDETNNCPICFERYKAGEVITTLVCKHEYHQNCIKLWNMNNCPLCRHDIIEGLEIRKSPINSDREDLVSGTNEDDMSV